MNRLFVTPITDLASAQAWVRSLIEAGLLFHFDDDTSDLPCFSDEEAVLISQRVKEMRAAFGKACPFAYAQLAEAELQAARNGGPTLEQFRASRVEVEDIGAAINQPEAFNDEPVAGFVYMKETYIQKLDGEFYLQIGNEEELGSDLAAMEVTLYRWFISECF